MGWVDGSRVAVVIGSGIGRGEVGEWIGHIVVSPARIES